MFSEGEEGVSDDLEEDPEVTMLAHETPPLVLSDDLKTKIIV